MVYFRSSTIAGGLLIVIFVLAQVLRTVIRKAPLAGLLVHDQVPLSGSEMSTNSVYVPVGTIRSPIVRSASVFRVVAALAPARHTGYCGLWLISPSLVKIGPRGLSPGASCS